MGWLALPALKVLRISRRFDCPGILCAFFDRSACALDELAFFEFDLRIDVVARILSRLSILRLGGKISEDGDSGLCVSNETLQMLMWPSDADVNVQC